MINNNQLFNIC